METLCVATGWDFSLKAKLKPHKRRPFGTSFEALGVCFSIFPDYLQVSNTGARNPGLPKYREDKSI
eukprot:5610264-Amphidinium_carterae.1